MGAALESILRLSVLEQDPRFNFIIPDLLVLAQGP
jgi:hypothetical protein